MILNNSFDWFMMYAIILAAGVGTRLRPLTEDIPKCLVKVGGRSILSHQIYCLTYIGVKKIYIVAGHMYTLIRNEIDEIDTDVEIELVINHKYNSTNNMYSLALVLNSVWLVHRPTDDQDHWLILNGDVVHEEAIYQKVTEAHKFLHLVDAALVVDRGTYLSESMKIIVDDSGFVKELSKGITKKRSDGTSTDFYSFSTRGLLILRHHINKILQTDQNQWTEVAMNDLVSAGKLKATCIDISGSKWWEIDNLTDLRIANKLFKYIDGIGPLIQKKGFVFDFDGTIACNNQALPKAAELLRFLKDQGKKIAIISNNSSRSIGQYLNKIENLFDLNLHESQIMTSTKALIEYLKNNNIENAYIFGTSEFYRELADHNIVHVPGNPEAILLGYDNTFDFQTLADLTIFIQNNPDIPILATHGDYRCPSKYGFVPDLGAIISMIHLTTQRKPDLIIGKPNTKLLETIANLWNFEADEIVMFGDRLSTDIAMGNNFGATSVLFMTGDTSYLDLIENEFLPDYIFNNPAELYAMLKLENLILDSSMDRENRAKL